MSKVKMCIICHKNPATVPDRNCPGRPIKKLCRECHANRLRHDVLNVINEKELNEKNKGKL